MYLNGLFLEPILFMPLADCFPATWPTLVGVCGGEAGVRSYESHADLEIFYVHEAFFSEK